MASSQGMQDNLAIKKESVISIRESGRWIGDFNVVQEATVLTTEAKLPRYVFNPAINASLPLSIVPSGKMAVMVSEMITAISSMVQTCLSLNHRIKSVRFQIP